LAAFEKRPLLPDPLSASNRDPRDTEGYLSLSKDEFSADLGSQKRDGFVKAPNARLAAF